MYSKPIQQLISAFSDLPGVGERTAERYVFYLLKTGKKSVAELTLALKGLIENVKSCEICWNFSDRSPCNICADKNRDQSTICVVAEPQDIPPFEKTSAFNGVYHVLRGVVKPEEDNRLKLKINNLFTRLKNPSTPFNFIQGKPLRVNKITEIILAFNPDLTGETTIMFLRQKINIFNPNLKITRLARGLPVGSDLQYADEITLEGAIKNRTEDN